MAELAPGNILQKMYLKERIAQLHPKTFCEIGSGNGYLSKLFLDKGMSGRGYDLNESACKNNTELNQQYINNKQYTVTCGDFFDSVSGAQFDYIISCMVIEHLDQDMVNKYFENCKKALTSNGVLAVFVPANMKYWGIEDVIAGHFKRYSFDDFKDIAKKNSLTISDIAGLNFPISNWLLRLSNYLVKKNEGYKEEMTMQEQTVLSGNRNVKFKTSFPWYFKLILNDVTMYPFHLMQKMNKNNSKSMVIYCEFKK